MSLFSGNNVEVFILSITYSQAVHTILSSSSHKKIIVGITQRKNDEENKW